MGKNKTNRVGKKKNNGMPNKTGLKRRKRLSGEVGAKWSGMKKKKPLSQEDVDEERGIERCPHQGGVKEKAHEKKRQRTEPHKKKKVVSEYPTKMEKVKSFRTLGLQFQSSRQSKKKKNRQSLAKKRRIQDKVKHSGLVKKKIGG